MDVKTVDYDRFRDDLEGAINSVIQRIVGDNLYNWDEDYITQDLLLEYRRRFKNIELKIAKKTIQVDSNAYKLRKKLSAEEKFGDIALVVKIQYSDHAVEGVAFLEAKKRTEKSRSFSAIKDEQLTRIYKNAPHAQLLLYDYESIHGDDDYKLQKLRGIKSSGSLHAVTLPMNIAISSGLKNTKLYRFSHPLSHQILTRYFRGLDLDFQQEALDIAKGYNQEIGSPQFLLVVSVTPSHGFQSNVNQIADQRSPNDNFFEEL
ncbi:hypothetical protein ACN4EK_29260 [Pantanalinema rosaneae CENA516]|uniref:hypothetical protein n=1 Tax=Pantanalinema rosaneae TaxID=1620701 RepID=UPI003D6E0EA1